MGVVVAHEFTAGGVLLERLTPGHSLVEPVLRGEDRQATAILAGVMHAMSPGTAPEGTPTVDAWGEAFPWYGATGDRRIPAAPTLALAEAIRRRGMGRR